MRLFHRHFLKCTQYYQYQPLVENWNQPVVLLMHHVPYTDHLRKSFVHTGSFVNSTTSRFTAVTASAPSGFTGTTENDFMFFINGMLVENDALTIQQAASNFLLKVDTDSIGYILESDDEIIAQGKFNS